MFFRRASGRRRPTSIKIESPRWIVTRDLDPQNDGDSIDTLEGTRSTNMPEAPERPEALSGWLEFRLAWGDTVFLMGRMERLTLEPKRVLRSGDQEGRLEIRDPNSGEWRETGIDFNRTHASHDS
jgi:hypothetical protein